MNKAIQESIERQENASKTLADHSKCFTEVRLSLQTLMSILRNVNKPEKVEAGRKSGKARKPTPKVSQSVMQEEPKIVLILPEPMESQGKVPNVIHVIQFSFRFLFSSPFPIISFLIAQASAIHSNIDSIIMIS